MFALLLTLLACGPDDKDADPDTASEGDADTDSDADSDADTDSDADVPLPAGTWGAEHWRLRVDPDGGGFIETDCAHGTLPGPLAADPAGHLVISFDWVTEGGPVPADTADVVSYPATLDATVAGTVIEGVVAIPDLAAEAPFRAELGVEPVLYKCL